MTNVEAIEKVNQDDSSPFSRKSKISLILFAVFLFWISLFIYVPTLPVYVQNKVENLSWVGFILATYGIWQMIIRLPLGIASDQVGRRKPFIIVGFLLSALGAWIMGNAKGVGGLAIGRSLSGFAVSSWVTLVILFNGMFAPEDAVRATSLLTLVNSVGRTLATGVTGKLNELGGYSLAFMVSAGASLIAVFVMLFVREKRLPKKAVTGKEILALITRRDVLLPSLLNMFRQYANWGITLSFIPILASQFGASDNQLSALTSMNIAIGIAGNLFATVAAKKIGSRRLIYASILLMGGAVGLAAIASSLAFIFFAQFCNGLAGGIGYPVLMGSSIEKVSEGERATAMGLHQAVYAVGMSAGPWLSGVLAEGLGLQSMFAVTAVGYLGLSLLGARLLK
jgi:DHA1 family multidrug resistance protein-like MFS transporter